VTHEVAIMSNLVRTTVEGDPQATEIPILTVRSKVLGKVVSLSIDFYHYFYLSHTRIDMGPDFDTIYSSMYYQSKSS
jgi:hypothetical protein